MKRTAIETVRHKGHVIKVYEEFGWSDVQQTMVNNGFRVEIDGPHYSLSQQTYHPSTRYYCQAIDCAILKAKEKPMIDAFLEMTAPDYDASDRSAYDSEKIALARGER